MANKITVSVHFYFKGIEYQPRLALDLDEIMRLNDALSTELYSSIAIANHIDLYSYEYEVMLEEEILFSDAEGLAGDFFHDGYFDIAGFEQAWRDQQYLQLLDAIAKQHMGIESLSAQPQLQAALLAAYTAGKNSR
ncbi:MAG: hypothetical protein OEW58_01465 [Gammaproteobacteria bacterium]|nr:hypothetical protein [Gammaproteobacteria bacterium]